MTRTVDDLVVDLQKGYLTRRGFLAKAGALGLSAAVAGSLADRAEASSPGEDSPAALIGRHVTSGRWQVVDLSVTTAENHPTNWPTDPLFQIVPLTWFKRLPGPNGTNGAVEPSDAAVQRYEITSTPEHKSTSRHTSSLPPEFTWRGARATVSG